MSSKNKGRSKKNNKRFQRQLKSGKVEKTFRVITEKEIVKKTDDEGNEETVTEEKGGKLKEVETPNKRRQKADSESEKQSEKERAQIKSVSAAERKAGVQQKSKITDIRAARRREKNKKRIKSLVIVLVIAIFAAAVYLTRSYWVPKLEGVLDRPRETVVNDGKIQSGNFPLSFSEGSVSSISGIGNYLACLDKNQLKIYNESGEETNSFSHNYADPVLKTALKRMMVYDKGGSSLMVMNRKNEMFSKTVRDRIILAEIADNNNIAVVTEDDKYAAIMYIFDQNGREIFKWSSNARVLSVSFSADGEGCYVTTFSSKSGSLVSVMRYFRFNSSEEIVKSADLPVLALKALENDNGEFWIVGDTAFLRLDEDGNIIMQYDYTAELIDFDLSSGCAALCFDGIQRKSTELIMFSSDSDSSEPDSAIYTDDGDPVSLHIKDSKVILLKNRLVECYDYSGNLLATAELTADYTDFTYFSDNIYFLDYREINKISFTT